MPEVKAGQVWYDSSGEGFAHVRAVESKVNPREDKAQLLAAVSGPAEFWNDCKTMKAMRRVAVVLMEPAHGWHGPYDEPAKCPMAQYYPSLLAWGRKDLLP